MARHFKTDLEEQEYVEIDLPPQERTANLLFCIDKSGSMSGSPIQSVCQVIRAKFQQSAKRFDVIAYDTTITRMTTGDVAQKDIVAGGGTDFVQPITAITKFIKDTMQSTTAIFMTDGQDSNGAGSRALTAAMSELKLIAGAMKARPVTIHVIGFGDVDRDFLNKIRLLGNRPGVLVYASESRELGANFDRLFELAESERCVSVRIGSRATFELTSADNTVRFLTSDPAIVEGAAVVVRLPPDTAEHTSVLSAIDPVRAVHRARALDLILPETEDVVKDIIERLNRLQPESSGDAERAEVERTVDAIRDRMMRHINLFTRIRLEGATPALKMMTEALKHDARFGGTQRDTLDLRMYKNASDTAFFMRNDTDKVLRDLQKAIDAPAWADIKRLADDWVCYASKDDFGSVMRTFHDNYLCVGVMVEWDDALVVSQPARGLKLVRITDTVVSFAHFVRAAAAHTDSNGPFEMVGQTPNERFNAVVPLFLNEQHMKRVRILEGVWLGTLFTRNALGYHKEQEVGLLRLLYDAIRVSQGSTATTRRCQIVKELEALCRFLVKESEGFRAAYGLPRTRDTLLSGDLQCRSDSRDLEVHMMAASLSGAASPDYLLAVYYEHVRRETRQGSRKTSADNETLVRRLMYGNGEQKITKQVSPEVAGLNEGDYLEKSYEAYFYDERRTPIPLIPETSTGIVRRVIIDADRSLVLQHAPPVPEFLKVMLRHLGLDEDFIESTLSSERLRIELVAALTYDMVPHGVSLTTVLAAVDERLQGDPNAAVRFDLSEEHVMRVARKLADCVSLACFAGLLRKYCPRRCEHFLTEAVRLILDNPSQLGREKLEALLTNRVGFDVLYANQAQAALDDISWVPPPEISIGELRSFVGDQRLAEIERANVVAGKVRLRRYRPAGKITYVGGLHLPNGVTFTGHSTGRPVGLNRSGHGNANPYFGTTFPFTGYSFHGY
eukprot:TRINITY_DN174_c0_g2_i1.p1 TRINITY_DN174_c0_g2~~TRINITY_DN174_c0_g2_i1.p1  ORF type:complete len:956 (-),score=228.86 TRINITY_DN174_c0_g2_i1:1679-4546(-)